MNDDVKQAMERVETLRAEIRTLDEQLRGVVAETMKLSGVGGMWAKLTGTYDKQVEEAERVVLTLRADLADKQQRLETAERGLTSARQRAQAAWSPDVPVAPSASSSAQPGDTAGQLATLEDVLRQLRRAAERIGERAGMAAPGPVQDPAGRMTTYRRGEGLKMVGAGRSNTDLGSVGARWESLVDDAERLADHLGIYLALPRLLTASARSHSVHAHPDSAPARSRMGTSDVADFASAVEASVPSIEDWITEVRAARRGQARGDAAGGRAAGVAAPAETPSSDVRAQLASQWDTLFGIAEILDREAKPGTRTADLLGPMSRWNQQATATRAYAEAHGLNPIPPINQGGDLLGFVDGLRAMLPMLEEQVDDLRS